MKRLSEVIKKLEEINSIYPDIDVNIDNIIIHFSIKSNEESYITFK